MATALIPAGASLLTSILGKGASKKATRQQNALYQKALDQQQGQFNQTQANFSPFLSGGGAALASSLDLLGLHGNDPQAAAIAALKASPGFTSLYNTGVDSILQNAAATGGLRGGNLENGALPGSLPGFSSNLLAQVIQQQLGNLGGISNLGVGAANSIASAGQANSNALTNLYDAMGRTQASGTLGQAGILNTGLNGLFAGLSGLPGLGGGLGSGTTGPFKGILGTTKLPGILGNIGAGGSIGGGFGW